MEARTPTLKRRNPRPRSRSVDGDLREHISSLGSLIEAEIYSRLRRPPTTRRATRRTIDDSSSQKTHSSTLSKSCSEVISRGKSHLQKTTTRLGKFDSVQSTLATLRSSRRVLFEPCSVASDVQISRWTDGGGLSAGKWVQCYLAVIGSSAGPRLLIFANSDADAVADQDFAFSAFVNCKRFESELREIHLIGSPGVPSLHFRISNELHARYFACHCITFAHTCGCCDYLRCSDYAGHLKHQLLSARRTPRVGWGRLPKLSTPDVGKVHNAISRKLRRQQIHGGGSLLTWATRTVKQLVTNQQVRLLDIHGIRSRGYPQVDLAELWECSGSQGLAQSPCRQLAVELSEYCAEFAQKMYRECGCEQEVGEASELNCWLAQMQLHEVRAVVYSWWCMILH